MEVGWGWCCSSGQAWQQGRCGSAAVWAAVRLTRVGLCNSPFELL